MNRVSLSRLKIFCGYWRAPTVNPFDSSWIQVGGGLSTKHPSRIQALKAGTDDEDGVFLAADLVEGSSDVAWFMIAFSPCKIVS